MLKIKLSGEYYNEKCILVYSGDEIYKGYVDDLITSQNGYLEMRLNYGLKLNFSVGVKRAGDIFILVPMDPFGYKWIKKYKPVIVSLEEIKMVWEKFNYNFDDDTRYIRNANFCDIFLTWVLSSGIKYNQNDLKNIMKTFKDKIITFIPDDFINLLNLIEELVEKNEEISEKDFVSGILNTTKIYIIYLQENNKIIEWDAIYVDDQGNYYLNLMGYFIKLAI